VSRHDLQDGSWIELRDPKKVSERLRRPVMSAATRLFKDQGALADLESAEDAAAAARMLPPDFLDGASELNDLVSVALISDWSFDAPVSTDALLDLPGPVYDEIRDLCAPLFSDVLPDFEPSPDPKVLPAS
jgi:hypothetical protein